jgi:hypothetical protein
MHTDKDRREIGREMVIAYDETSYMKDAIKRVISKYPQIPTDVLEMMWYSIDEHIDKYEGS